MHDKQFEGKYTKRCSFQASKGSPIMCTPQRVQKRVSLREMAASNELRPKPSLEPRQLTYACVNDSIDKVKEKWCSDELKALIEFVLFNSSGEQWPSHKQAAFWNSAGRFVKERSGSSMCRSGMPLYNIHKCRFIFVVLFSKCLSF